VQEVDAVEKIPVVEEKRGAGKVLKDHNAVLTLRRGKGRLDRKILRLQYKSESLIYKNPVYITSIQIS
jgi:hypothetical protein